MYWVYLWFYLNHYLSFKLSLWLKAGVSWQLKYLVGALDANSTSQSACRRTDTTCKAFCCTCNECSDM
jgi:hypothetical protein